MGALNELAQAINDNARAKGFWDADRNFGEMLMLATSELAEALEEHRASSPNVYYVFSMPKGGLAQEEIDATGPLFYSEISGQAPIRSEYTAELIRTAHPRLVKPEGVAVELADALIRILDIMHSLDVDIDAIVAEKMAYNATRPVKHGKAY